MSRFLLAFLVIVPALVPRPARAGGMEALIVVAAPAKGETQVRVVLRDPQGIAGVKVTGDTIDPVSLAPSPEPLKLEMVISPRPGESTAFPFDVEMTDATGKFVQRRFSGPGGYAATSLRASTADGEFHLEQWLGERLMLASPSVLLSESEGLASIKADILPVRNDTVLLGGILIVTGARDLAATGSRAVLEITSDLGSDFLEIAIASGDPGAFE